MFSGDQEADWSARGAIGGADKDSGSEQDKTRRRKGISSPSILSADLTIRGDVETAGDLHIDGVILGDVRSRKVTIGKDGEVRGKVEGEEVNIRGLLKGEVEAKAVILSKTAKVEATIIHDTLSVEPGAEMLGRSTRRKVSAEPPAPESKPTQTTASEAEAKAGEKEDGKDDRTPDEATDSAPSPESKTPPASAIGGSAAAPSEKPTSVAAEADTPSDKNASAMTKPDAPAKPIFEPLPAVIAAGPADLDGPVIGDPLKGKDGSAQRGETQATASDDGGSTSSGGLRFRPLGTSQVTP